MSNQKNVMTENDMSLLVVEAAPVQRVSKAEIEAATKRMSVIVADAPNMSTEQLATIAQESILYRTVPGRDVHYFLNGGKLSKVLDYKYLKNFANFKEQLLSGNDNATIDDSYRILSDEERAAHNIGDNMIAAKCTIVTERERNQFGNEVKRWLDMGFDAKLAIATAKEAIGDLGSSAVGIVPKSGATPKGWSSMQLAEKLAFKNAVNRKYGQPTADEMAMMAYRMAQKATPDHWKDVDPTLPIEAQAKEANLNAQAEANKIEAEAMTTDEHKERLNKNASLLRGEDEGAIGEDVIDGESTAINDDWLRFVELIKFRVPYFYGEAGIKAVLDSLELVYDVENEEMLFDALAEYASDNADKEAASQ